MKPIESLKARLSNDKLLVQNEKGFLSTVGFEWNPAATDKEISFSSKSTETLLSELQKAAKGSAVAQAILRYQQDNSFKCKSDSDQISIQKFFPTCGLMDEYFRWLLL